MSVVARICGKCNVGKPRDDFARRARAPDGLQSYCRSCMTTYRKQWKEDNRDRINEKARQRYAMASEKFIAKAAQWNRENPDRINATNRASYKRHAERRRSESREWRRNNLGKALERDRDYYAKNSELRRAMTRRWRRQNPDKARTMDANKKAMRKGAPVGNKLAVARFLKWARCEPEVSCTYCGTLTTPAFRHVDHATPLSRGGWHCVTNLCIACPPCNLSKRAMTAQEFRARLSRATS